jgi:hypothetical protein
LIDSDTVSVLKILVGGEAEISPFRVPQTALFKIPRYV